MPIDGGYDTHFPVLKLAIAITSGPILELGCGEGSTPFLHTLGQNRLVVSAETSSSWLAKYSAKYASHTHRFVKVDDWRDFEEIEERDDWSVALVDCAPGEDRADLANRLAFRCEFVLLHDSEKNSGGNYRYHRCIGNFRRVVEYTKYRPHTLILSNERRFPIEECE